MNVELRKKIAAVMSYYKVLSKERDDFRWSTKRKRFTLDKANAFFVGVLLDQGQKAERAWNGGEHLVKNHFKGFRGFWSEVLAADQKTVDRICTSGYDGKSYALNFPTKKFPIWLREAAKKMVDQYNGDPRNIWAVPPENVGLIYDRFKEFKGIGDALAPMAQFILVRKYGVGGGIQNQSKLSVKPDVLVRRVLARTGLTESGDMTKVIGTLRDFKLTSPADFDASLWVIGREYCKKTDPNCEKCPLEPVCSYATSYGAS